jgi:FkbM family methyltransferase
MQIKIMYGTIDKNIDVTNICYTQLMDSNKIITILDGDNNRAHYFTDPIEGVLKKIFILTDVLKEYSSSELIKINTLDNTVTSVNIENEISIIHNQLSIKYGLFCEELPEQKMSLRYLTGNEKVLEIGGNIGRNSLIIGHILKQKNNNDFVVMETDPNIASQLIENRDSNNINFHVENSALSLKKLIQRGWNTVMSDVVLENYINVDIISWDSLLKKYNIQFNTLVLDCEGAFYYILLDMPEILDNINLIIMENDYPHINHKNYVNEMLYKNNFYRDYSESGGWGACYDCFFEVWKRRELIY